MKFLCVECDEAMKLQESRGPDEGSMTVIFACPTCDRKMAMLTNPMETQMVRSLDVKIGGAAGPHEPMATLKESLATRRTDLFHGDAPDVEPAQDRTASGKCPFSDMVEEGANAANDLTWTPEARERVDRIPPFVRSMARKGIEDYAREKGYRQIDAAVMDEVKGRFGM